MVKTTKGSVGLKDTSGAAINPATEDTVSQLVMAVTNAIDETAFDLNVAAFNETTVITSDYDLISVEMNFTTTSIRDITITSFDGTIIFEDQDNIDKSIVLSDFGLSFNSGEEITIEITQTGAACSADVILRIQNGTNSLLGNPEVRITDNNNVDLLLDQLVESVPTTGTFHHLGHHGKVFLHSNKHPIASLADLDELIKVPASPAGRQVHLRFNYTASDIPGDLCLYRDVVVSADGTPEIINSNNDAVVKTTGVTIFEGPTISDIGNLWSCSLLTGQKNSAGSADQLIPEYILTPGVNYLLRYTNNNNSTIDLVTAIFFYDSEAS